MDILLVEMSFDSGLEGWNWLKLATQNQKHIPDRALQGRGHRFVSDSLAAFSPLGLISLLLSSLFLSMILKWWQSYIAMTTQCNHEPWQLCSFFRSDVLSRPFKQIFLILFLSLSLLLPLPNSSWIDKLSIIIRCYSEMNPSRIDTSEPKESVVVMSNVCLFF